ncbi:MAG: trypsin-like peptidase domain-containing protein [Pirellulales bacterium]
MRSRQIAAGSFSIVVLLWGQPAAAQDDAGQVTGLQAAFAVESLLVDAIERAEKSVVALAIFRKSNDQLALPGAVPEIGDIPDQFGTGVVIDRKGLILTNYHVLRTDEPVWVAVAGRRAYMRARVKGADPRSDLAVLEVLDETGTLDLTPVTFGDAAKLKKGQIVIALGNPYAIARDGQVSASWGIVSNLQRKAAPEAPSDSEPTGKPTLHHYGTLIQTDAKLNLGTSGGALVNLKGEMVGLTTSLAAVAGYEKSAGYAVPVDETFRRVVDTLKQGREVEYGFLGIGPDDLSRGDRLRGEQGVQVANVVSGLPAAGVLFHGDVITHVNGAPLADTDGLMLEIGRQPAGSEVELRVKRSQRHLRPKVKLAKYNVRGDKVVTTPGPQWRGLRVDFVSAHWAPTRFVSPPANCVYVTEVEENSPAWQAGLRPGNLIGQVDGQPTATPDEFFRAVGRQRGAISIRLMDEGIERPLRTVE